MPWASLLEGEEPTYPREAAPSHPLRGSVSHPLQPPDCTTFSAWILSVVESSLLPKIVYPKELLALLSLKRSTPDSVVPASCAVLVKAFATWASSSSDPTLTTSVCGPAITRRVTLSRPQYCRSGHSHSQGDLLRVPLGWAEEGRGGLMKSGNRCWLCLSGCVPIAVSPLGFPTVWGKWAAGPLSLFQEPSVPCLSYHSCLPSLSEVLLCICFFRIMIARFSCNQENKNYDFLKNYHCTRIPLYPPAPGALWKQVREIVKFSVNQ